MSAFDSSITQTEDDTEPPRSVNVAFWLYLAAALVYVPSLIISIAEAGSERGTLVANGISPANAAATVHLALVVVVVGSVLGILLLSFMAVVFRGGAGWARIVLLVLSALGTVSTAASVVLVSTMTSDYGLGALHAVLMIVATIFAFLPESSQWLRRIKAAITSGRLT